MEQIVPVYMLLVAGACIPDLTKLATQFVSAPVGSRVTTPGSCYDFNEHKFDEHNFDTHHSNANYAAQAQKQQKRRKSHKKLTKNNLFIQKRLRFPISHVCNKISKKISNVQLLI